jgi:serine/threonine protein kinase
LKLTLVFPDAQSGDLHNSIEDGTPKSEVRKIIDRLLQAFEYPHGIRIWHPDIKPEKILIMTNNVG